jgi:hypothetical protein
MGAGSDAARHASRRYRRMFAWARRPVRSIEQEAHHLREIEQAGESAETPYIAALGLFFFLGSIFVVMLGIALAAYYLG